MVMELGEAERILKAVGINLSAPIITQVSRFDPWKDPIGVIESFHLIKEKFPDAQLVLSGIMQAQDDPEAAKVVEDVKVRATKEKGVYLFTSIEQLQGIPDLSLLMPIRPDLT